MYNSDLTSSLPLHKKSFVSYPESRKKVQWLVSRPKEPQSELSQCNVALSCYDWARKTELESVWLPTEGYRNLTFDNRMGSIVSRFWWLRLKVIYELNQVIYHCALQRTVACRDCLACVEAV